MPLIFVLFWLALFLWAAPTGTDAALEHGRAEVREQRQSDCSADEAVSQGLRAEVAVS